MYIYRFLILTFGQLMPGISTCGQFMVVNGLFYCDRPNERIRFPSLPWSTIGCHCGQLMVVVAKIKILGIYYFISLTEI
jgi:hypothetical protein